MRGRGGGASAFFLFFLVCFFYISWFISWFFFLPFANKAIKGCVLQTFAILFLGVLLNNFFLYYSERRFRRIASGFCFCVFFFVEAGWGFVGNRVVRDKGWRRGRNRPVSDSTALYFLTNPPHRHARARRPSLTLRCRMNKKKKTACACVCKKSGGNDAEQTKEWGSCLGREKVRGKN